MYLIPCRIGDGGAYQVVGVDEDFLALLRRRFSKHVLLPAFDPAAGNLQVRFHNHNGWRIISSTSYTNHAFFY